MEISNKTIPSIPQSISRLFQEYRFADLNIELHSNLFIERILESGTWEELRWLVSAYSIRRIQNYIRRFGHTRLTPVAFNYWRKLFKVGTCHRSPWSNIRKDVWRY